MKPPILDRPHFFEKSPCDSGANFSNSRFRDRPILQGYTEEYRRDARRICSYSVGSMRNLVRIQLANGVVDSPRELRLIYESGWSVHMAIISRSGAMWRGEAF